MPSIYLYVGEINSNDIRLRDPTSLGVSTWVYAANGSVILTGSVLLTKDKVILSSTTLEITGTLFYSKTKVYGLVGELIIDLVNSFSRDKSYDLSTTIGFSIACDPSKTKVYLSNITITLTGYGYLEQHAYLASLIFLVNGNFTTVHTTTITSLTQSSAIDFITKVLKIDQHSRLKDLIDILSK